MGSRGISRRAFVARLAGSAVTLGLAALAAPRVTAIARAQETAGAPIPVRLGVVVQTGADFRGGLAEGVRLPGAGGDSRSLAAERPGGRFTSEPLRIDFACSHVGAHWRADGPEQGLRVEVRSSRDGQRWSGWRRVAVESHGREEPSGETFGALVGGRRGTWLQYRLTFSEAGPELAGVERVALTYLDAQPQPIGRAGGDLPPLSFAKLGIRAGKDAFLDRVIAREAWGADESIRFKEGEDLWPRAFVAPKLLVVHHTATENEYDDPTAEVRAIYTYHTLTRGFGDIGYNLLIDNRGQAYEGRLGRDIDGRGRLGREVFSPDVVAGHATGYNYGSVGIALLGTFGELDADDPRTLAAVEPSEPAVRTLEEALAFEAARHGLDPTEQLAFLRTAGPDGDFLWRDALNAVSGHRDCVPTECPGDRLYARLPELRERVAARLGPPGPRARIVEGPEDRDVWPTDLIFGWDGSAGAAEFSTRLEGWRRDGPDRIVPLSGYGPDERPIWGPWTPRRAASFPLPPDARGSYTLHVRARSGGGEEGLYAARWPLYVDRHVLADNRDPRRAARTGSWGRTSEILGFNGLDYEQAEPAGDAAGFAWTLEVPESGTYRVLACWTEGEFRATNARYAISSGGQQLAEAELNQRDRGGQWVELARVPLAAGTSCLVELTNRADGVVVADAVRITLA
jgi:hypothetical protein